MKRTIQLAVACVAVLVATAGQVQAGVMLDFTVLPEGPVSTIGDATFSLAGVGEMGDPFVEHSYGGGLWNSTDGTAYPTNTILRVDFAAPVDDVVFSYNPQGLNGRPGQGWTIYDSGLSVLDSGSFTSSSLATYDLTAYTGIARIEWNNGGNNWVSNLNTLSYESAVTNPVPEPTSFALFGIGACVAGLGTARRRRCEKQQEATA